jgi:hypothetical protein
MTYKPKKHTYAILKVIGIFGKDIGGIILDMMYQCDECLELEIGQIYHCSICSPYKQLCHSCWETKGIGCYVMPCLRCNTCGHYHCITHTPQYWWDLHDAHIEGNPDR